MIIKTASLIWFLVIVSANICLSQELTRLDSAIFNSEKKIETDNRSFFKNVESFIVSRNGIIVLERYFYGANKDSLYHTQSQTQSIVALLLGIAIDYGYIASEDNLVAPYFPGFFKKEDTLKSSIRIKDLITMSAGMKWEEMLAFDNPRNDNSNMFNSGNWLDYALSRPIDRKPFTEFKYCSGSPMIVAGIIQKATKTSLEAFAKKYLFDQLDITEFYWQKDATGFPHAGGGLWVKPVDMVKIGELVLHKGLWKNVQIISGSWIMKATQTYFVTSFGGYSYGYLWWVKEMKINETRSTKVISAQGAGGQNLYVFPEFELVVSFTESNYGMPVAGTLIINNFILPALE